MNNFWWIFLSIRFEKSICIVGASETVVNPTHPPVHKASSWNCQRAQWGSLNGSKRMTGNERTNLLTTDDRTSLNGMKERPGTPSFFLIRGIVEILDWLNEQGAFNKLISIRAGKPSSMEDSEVNYAIMKEIQRKQEIDNWKYYYYYYKFISSLKGFRIDSLRRWRLGILISIVNYPFLRDCFQQTQKRPPRTISIYHQQYKTIIVIFIKLILTGFINNL